MNKRRRPEIAIRGIAASPGFSIGHAFIYREPTYQPEMRIIAEDKTESEIRRLKKAVRGSINYLTKMYKDTDKRFGQEFAEIVQIQLSILDDQIFLDEVETQIKEKRYDAAYATFNVFSGKKEYFLQLSDEYFRERAFDIQNLKRLILKNMLGKKMEVKLKQKSIVVADNISPTDIIKLHQQEILGFCTNVGGKNSHAAIVARSFGVPAVVGTEYVTNMVKKGDHLILDGNEGIIIINPSEERNQTYYKKQKSFVIIEKRLINDAEKPAKTLDGHKIEVSANIEFLEELEQLTKSGAEGIGLYRTEGIFLGGNELPSEDYQTECYLQFAKEARPHDVVVRTLDVGGDKLLPELVGMPERNPFLGWRAIRFCLDHKEIFIPQLKAILRANKYGNLKILIPMVSSLEEINQFKKVFAEAIEILKSEGQKYNTNLPLGMMIEIPSAALMAEYFAREVDFFSLGTNDLIQYTLAVDRVNEKISHLYSHFHPALLALVKRVIDISDKHSIPINMCGEMAGDPVALPLLIGMGLRNFSAAHFVIPEVKNVIRHVSTIECQKLFRKIKKLPTSSEIQKVCETFYAKISTIPHNAAAKTH